MSTSTKTRGTGTTAPSKPTRKRRGEHPRTAPAPAATTQTPAPLMRVLDATLSDLQKSEVQAMTHQQRYEAIADGRLTLGQMAQWSRLHEGDVPLINNELGYIVRYTPEVCEAGQTEARP